MPKKAQAAMEFLMTYGWAIMVVLVVIGALVYFDVLNPANFLSESCVLTMPLNCGDYSVRNGAIGLDIANSGGRAVEITSVSITGDALAGVCSVALGAAVSIDSGESAPFTVTDAVNCAKVATGRDKNKYAVSVSYNYAGSTYTHTSTGKVFAKVEA